MKSRAAAIVLSVTLLASCASVRDCHDREGEAGTAVIGVYNFVPWVSYSPFNVRLAVIRDPATRKGSGYLSGPRREWYCFDLTERDLAELDSILHRYDVPALLRGAGGLPNEPCFDCPDLIFQVGDAYFHFKRMPEELRPLARDLDGYFSRHLASFYFSPFAELHTKERWK